MFNKMFRPKFAILMGCIVLVYSIFLVVLHATMRSKAALRHFDRGSWTTYYVEVDRRHVVAIGPSGRQLWRRDPFVDAKLQPYRKAHPKIIWIGSPSKVYAHKVYAHTVVEDCLSIAFDSSQFGLLTPPSGDFIFLGQD